MGGGVADDPEPGFEPEFEPEFEPDLEPELPEWEPEFPALEPEPESDPGLAPGSEPVPGSELVAEVVVAFAGGAFVAFGVDCSAASAGEIATSPTTPAASGNRNRRFIGRLLALVHLLLTNA